MLRSVFLVVVVAAPHAEASRLRRVRLVQSVFSALAMAALVRAGAAPVPSHQVRREARVSNRVYLLPEVGGCRLTKSTGVMLNTSVTKQHHDSTCNRPKHPKGPIRRH